MKIKKVLSLIVIPTLLIGVNSSCSNSGSLKADYEKISVLEDANPEKYPEFITVEIFDERSNFDGIQSGWFAEIVKQKFNMELKIIAPNVVGDRDNLYQSRVNAGDLGDLVIMGADNGKMQEVVSKGLIEDLTPYFENRDLSGNSSYAIETLNSLVVEDGIYGIPAEISEESPLESSEGGELTFGTYVRWDLYKQLGYPKLETLSDILPVLKEMQNLEPKTEDGKNVYGLSLFKDWDGNIMMFGKQPASLYGYDEIGFVFAKADGSKFRDILENDSPYIKSLQFYFDANQMGLLDPESETQNFDTLYKKYQNGEMLFSFWPWLGQDAYNTLDREELGKGFMVAPVEDLKIYSTGFKTAGESYFIGLGTNAEDKERLADFVEWLYSPEGISTQGVGLVEDVMWNMENGRPELTEFGIEVLMNGSDVPMPEELGGGTYREGISQLNFVPKNVSNTNSETNEKYDYTEWLSVLEKNTTALDLDWQTKMNALTSHDYFEKNNQIMVAPGSNYITPADEKTEMRNAIKEVIKDYSWKMVFAKDQEEFDTLLKTMQDTAISLGYEEILAVDMKNAEEQQQSRVEVVEIYGE